VVAENRKSIKPMFNTSNRSISLIIVCLILVLTDNIYAQKNIPLPKKSQLVWQDAELTAVIHYDLHVFDGKKYNQALNRITPIADYNIFNPTKLDTDQWIRAVKDMGGKIAILTATHETGFALYQSDVNPYSMKALKFQDGKGDLVRDFVASCRKYGILPGLYIGIRWNSNYGVYDFMVHNDNSPFAKNRQEHYNKLCEQMTEELMSRYGELAMVWFDGGAHGPIIIPKGQIFAGAEVKAARLITLVGEHTHSPIHTPPTKKRSSKMIFNYSKRVIRKENIICRQ